MIVALAPLERDALERVAYIAVSADQVRFAGTVAEAFAEDPARFDLHVILADDHPVGLFKIDRRYSETISIATPGELGLRAFMIDQTQQRRGIATEAIRQLGPYLAARYPDADAVALTVNHSNPLAIRAYLNGGFCDTGEDWPHGSAGPQDFLRLPLRTEPRQHPDDAHAWRMCLEHWLDRIRRTVPPGLRLVVGVALIVGGLLGFLPVLGFWMVPLGTAVAALDIQPIWRRITRQRK